MRIIMESITDAMVGVVAALVISLVASSLFRRMRAIQRRATSFREEPRSKPQYDFKRLLADNSYKPFNHLKGRGNDGEISSELHPYREEISSLLQQPPAIASFGCGDYHLEMSDSYVWVHSKQQLESLADLLRKEKAFSVDTEQHSLHSYLGFTALMQISTGKEDYLIDTIALHDVMDVLSPIFADPSICKVFHGADNDVIWLQRDFHIYIVNMFDTAKACAVLSKPHNSLAYLLETYCGVTTNKALQREDWRMRPLTEEMIRYARTDVHYLPYVSNILLSELRKEVSDVYALHDNKSSYFFEAIHRSNMLCMQLYMKEIEFPPGASSAVSIYSRIINMQGGVLQKNNEVKEIVWKLCTWRDIMARVHDESLRFTLSDPAIAALALKHPKNPVTVRICISEADLNSDSNNLHTLPSISPIVINHLDELCRLLQNSIGSLGDIFEHYVERYSETDRCCPFAVYNYALLLDFYSSERDTFLMKQNQGNFGSSLSKKAARELFIQKFSCKNPVYHNCKIYANDGRLLCFCDRKKLQWYLQRGLARIVDDDPPAIMLSFEPKGRPEDVDNHFYIQSKKNVCVGCGEKNHYLRYRIIPSCYRMHFPEHLKSHRSHDIVLLCVDCHEIAHSASEKYKKQVAVEFDIPLFVQMVVDVGGNKVINMSTRSDGEIEKSVVSPLQLRTAAMALLRHGSNMPERRRDELMQIMKSCFGEREVVAEDLETAILMCMGSHERRRLQKKKGFLHSNKIHKQKGTPSDISVECEEINPEACYRTLRDDENSPIVIETTEEKIYGSVEVSENEDLSKENNDICHNLSSSRKYPATKNSKEVSLLGHGPHGKLVVEHILNNQGEEGILHFCQRWRQVFVEAINPRFLPSGWDVMHSGRRDFGEYSVYNPLKR